MKTKHLKWFILFMVLLFTGISAEAQRPYGQKPEPGQRAAATVNRMGRKINMNENEKEVMESIYTTFFNNMESLRQKGDPEKNKETFNQLVAERDASVKKLLGSDRYSIYEQLLEEKQERTKQHLQQNGYNKPNEVQPEVKAKATANQLNNKLKLTENDLSELTGIWTDYFTKIDESRSEFTPDQKADLHKQLKDERDAKVRKLLKSDAQYIVYLEALKDGRQQMGKAIQRRGNKSKNID